MFLSAVLIKILINKIKKKILQFFFFYKMYSLLSKTCINFYSQQKRKQTQDILVIKIHTVLVLICQFIITFI